MSRDCGPEESGDREHDGMGHVGAPTEVVNGRGLGASLDFEEVVNDVARGQGSSYGYIA